jgi:hypothetical protein
MGLTGRNATIGIWNWTGFDLTYDSDKVIHGKYHDGMKPPQLIAADSMGCFAVGNHTGDPVGPKGILIYKVAGQSYKLHFTWDHPFGAATSAYYCFSEGHDGMIDAILFPNDPSGHDQLINWTVRKRS